jgi:hypothetical protein
MSISMIIIHGVSKRALPVMEYYYEDISEIPCITNGSHIKP